MTSIGALGSASHFAATTASQGNAAHGARHQASAADPDGDGDTGAAAGGASASPAAALSQALNTTA